MEIIIFKMNAENSKYLVLNPIHPEKRVYTFPINIYKHLSILTAKKLYRKINIYDRNEYPK